MGVLLSDSTLGDWFSAVCAKLRPLYDKLREKIMSSDYIQVDESTLPVIDNEKHRAVKGYVWAVRDAVWGDVYFHYDMGSRSGETARKLIGGYRGTIQTDGYDVNGNQKCSDFGNSECSIFGIKTTVLLASAVQ